MTSDRFGSISGLLASKPTPRQATVHPISVDTAAPDQNPEHTPRPQAESRAGRRTRTTPKSEESTGGTRRIAFRLDPDLHSRLVARAKTHDTTHGDVVLDAIEAAHSIGQLGQLVAAAKDEARPAAAGLFVRSSRRGTARPSIPVEIQLQAQAVVQLDRLVAEHGADTRTQLMVVALQHHLDT